MLQLVRVVLMGLSLAVAASSSLAQEQPKTPPQSGNAAAPAANPADVASPDAILDGVYAVISGPAGQKRDWDRMRSLFYPGARLIHTGPDKDGAMKETSFTVDEYIQRATPYFDKSGFFEREAARHTDKWGNILQAFSTYESRHDAKDATPFARGINSFQLFFDGKRWWIVTIYWQEESATNPLPAEFLPHAH